jgi:hypothetical protein
VLCVMVIMCVFSTAGFSGTLDLDFRKRTPENAALRSALVPGWGQIFNEQVVKGWVAGTVFFVSVGSYFYYNGIANQDYTDYEARGLVDDSLYSDYETHRQQANTAIYVAAGTWVVAIIDAYIFGNSDADNKKQSLRPSGFQWALGDCGPSLRWKRYF